MKKTLLILLILCLTIPLVSAKIYMIEHTKELGLGNVTADTCTAGNYSQYNGTEFLCRPDTGGGSGDITEVNASTGLTGGGSSGSVALALNTTFTGSYANWNTAFDWGDHDLPGYLTSYTETDPLWAANVSLVGFLAENENIGGTWTMDSSTLCTAKNGLCNNTQSGAMTEWLFNTTSNATTTTVTNSTVVQFLAGTNISITHNGNDITFSSTSSGGSIISSGGWTNNTDYTVTSLDVNITGELRLKNGSGDVNYYVEDNSHVWVNMSTNGIAIRDFNSIGTVAKDCVGIGQDVTSTGVGFGSVAIGTLVTASNQAAIAIGYRSYASGVYSVAMGGFQPVATGQNSFAFGHEAIASGPYSMAFNRDAAASANSAMAFGYQAIAAGDYSTAIGALANTSHTSGMAFGREATTTAVNQFALGSVGYPLDLVSEGNALFKSRQSTDVTMTLKGAAAQTANLTEWQNSTSDILASVSPEGYFNPGECTGSYTAGDLCYNSTANRHYGYNGTLNPIY